MDQNPDEEEKLWIRISRPNQHNFQIQIFFRISRFISWTLDLFPESLVYLSEI